MQSSAIFEMFDCEDRHWWYQSTHALVKDCIRRFSASAQRLFDAGCGSGGLLLKLAPILDCWGIDKSPTAVALARHKLGRAYADRIQVGSIENLEAFNRERGFDVITCVDVLYHQGICDWRGTLRRFASALGDGGLLILQVAAFEYLRGEHDVAVEGVRRFCKQEVSDALQAAGFSVELISYRFCFLFPVLLSLRFKQALFSSKIPCSNLRMGSKGLAHSIAKRLALWENKRTLAGCYIPFGSSIFAVGRRTEHPSSSPCADGPCARNRAFHGERAGKSVEGMRSSNTFGLGLKT